MKRLFLLAITAVVLTGCTTRKADNKTEPSGNTAQLELSAVEESKAMAEGEVNYLTTADFKRRIMDFEANPDKWVFEGKRPAVIDFYTEWCGPCKMMAPIVKKMAADRAGEIDFYNVDIDKEQELAELLGIRSIPTFLFIPLEGKPTVQVGAMQKEDFEHIIESMLKK